MRLFHSFRLARLATFSDYATAACCHHLGVLHRRFGLFLGFHGTVSHPGVFFPDCDKRTGNGINAKNKLNLVGLAGGSSLVGHTHTDGTWWVVLEFPALAKSASITRC